MKIYEPPPADVQITCLYINSLFREESPFLANGELSQPVINSAILQTVSYCIDYAPFLTYNNIAILVLQMAYASRQESPPGEV